MSQYGHDRIVANHDGVQIDRMPHGLSLRDPYQVTPFGPKQAASINISDETIAGKRQLLISATLLELQRVEGGPLPGPANVQIQHTCWRLTTDLAREFACLLRAGKSATVNEHFRCEADMGGYVGDADMVQLDEHLVYSVHFTELAGHVALQVYRESRQTRKGRRSAKTETSGQYIISSALAQTLANALDWYAAEADNEAAWRTYVAAA
jgi:hypothetical protein